jgi:hypothetical protein
MNSTLFFGSVILTLLTGILLGFGIERSAFKHGLTNTLLRNGKAHYEVNAITGETTLIVNPEFEILSGFTNK